MTLEGKTVSRKKGLLIRKYFCVDQDPRLRMPRSEKQS
jgi:hypothetical protein